MEMNEIPPSTELDHRQKMGNNSFVKDQENLSQNNLSAAPSCNCGQKPTNIPLKFWDEKRQKIRIEALLKSYTNLEKRMTELQDENDALLEVIQLPDDTEAEVTFTGQDIKHKCPATPEEYDLQVDGQLFDNDPWVNKVLHEAGFSNEQAQLVYDLAEAELAPIAEEIGHRYRLESDLQRLEAHFGGKARWREISRQIRNWANKNLPHHAYDALSSSYEGILAMYAILDQKDEPGLIKGQADSGQLEEGDLRKMMKDPKYWQDRDPSMVRKVTEGFQRLYGN